MSNAHIRIARLCTCCVCIRCLSVHVTGVTDFSTVDVVIANPLRLKGLEEEGKVDLSKVSRGCLIVFLQPGDWDQAVAAMLHGWCHVWRIHHGM
jgi:hypothetical protein